MSLYQYVKSSSPNHRDPFGLLDWGELFSGIGVCCKGTGKAVGGVLLCKTGLGAIVGVPIAATGFADFGVGLARALGSFDDDMDVPKVDGIIGLVANTVGGEDAGEIADVIDQGASTIATFPPNAFDVAGAALDATGEIIDEKKCIEGNKDDDDEAAEDPDPFLNPLLNPMWPCP